MAEKSKETKTRGVTDKKSDKLSYEQLEQVANNMGRKCQQLYDELQNARAEIARFDAVGLLLNIIANGEHFDASFIDRCALKIQNDVSAELDKAEKLEEEKDVQQA